MFFSVLVEGEGPRGWMPGFAFLMIFYCFKLRPFLGIIFGKNIGGFLSWARACSMWMQGTTHSAAASQDGNGRKMLGQKRFVEYFFGYVFLVL